MRSTHRGVQAVLDAQHRRRVDRRTFKDARVELPLLGHSEDLQACPLEGLEPLDGARREDEDAAGALPPSTFAS